MNVRFPAWNANRALLVVSLAARQGRRVGLMAGLATGALALFAAGALTEPEHRIVSLVSWTVGGLTALYFGGALVAWRSQPSPVRFLSRTRWDPSIDEAMAANGEPRYIRLARRRRPADESPQR